MAIFLVSTSLLVDICVSYSIIGVSLICFVSDVFNGISTILIWVDIPRYSGISRQKTTAIHDNNQSVQTGNEESNVPEGEGKKNVHTHKTHLQLVYLIERIYCQIEVIFRYSVLVITAGKRYSVIQFTFLGQLNNVAGL